MEPETKIESENIARKEYTYSIGKTSLKFTLRTDIKSELKDFKELMKRAIEDIDEDLRKLELGLANLA